MGKGKWGRGSGEERRGGREERINRCKVKEEKIVHLTHSVQWCGSPSRWGRRGGGGGEKRGGGRGRGRRGGGGGRGGKGGGRG